MSYRNVFTNLIGVALSAYGTSEIAHAKMTIEKFAAIVPTAIVAFATGAKDDKLAQVVRALNLNESDKQAAHGIAQITLNQFAHRVGLQVLPYEPENGELNAATLDRIATESDVRSRDGSRPAVDPASVTADYWARQEARRLPNMPQREAPGNLPEWLEFSQSNRIDTEF